jgi:hypothetical protein
MKPTLSYKDFLIESNCSECMSEDTKQKLHEVCRTNILKEATDYHNDDDPEHTYEVYVNECMSYMNEMLGSAGYSSSHKQTTN